MEGAVFFADSCRTSVVCSVIFWLYQRFAAGESFCVIMDRISASVRLMP